MTSIHKSDYEYESDYERDRDFKEYYDDERGEALREREFERKQEEAEQAKKKQATN